MCFEEHTTFELQIQWMYTEGMEEMRDKEERIYPGIEPIGGRLHISKRNRNILRSIPFGDN